MTPIKRPTGDPQIVEVMIGVHLTAGSIKPYQTPSKVGTELTDESATDELSKNDALKNVVNVMKPGKPMRLTSSGQWMPSANATMIVAKMTDEGARDAKLSFLQIRFRDGMAASGGQQIDENWSVVNWNDVFDQARLSTVVRRLASDRHYDRLL